MPVVILNSSSFVGELSEVPERGVEYASLVTLAPDPDQPPIRAYLKIFPSDYGLGLPGRGLINELVGYLCAEWAGRRVPPSAGLIALDYAQLSSPPDFLDPARPVICWWTQDAKANSLHAAWNPAVLPPASQAAVREEDVAREFFTKHSATASIVAFDDLVANVDRNIGNLLQAGGDLILIDHAYSLTGPSWKSTDLVAEGKYRNEVRRLMGSNGDLLPFKAKIMNEHANMVSKLDPKMGELKGWLDHLLDAGDSVAAHEFILKRFCPALAAERVGVLI